MSSRVQTTIETTRSTVLLLSQDCVFSKQLQVAIESLHLHVVRIDPLNIQKSLLQDQVRSLFQTSYVCVWIDIPLFVSTQEKQAVHSTTISALQTHLGIPLHLITFDTTYKRKNGREGDVPTFISTRLPATVLKAFPTARCFSYSHVVYPFEGGVSIVQRFLLEKIQQGNRFPLFGSWKPLWYTEVISHVVATLYDLSMKGGVFEGMHEIDLHSFESRLRKESHNQSLTGPMVDFPFSFTPGEPIGNTPITTVLEELSLITLPAIVENKLPMSVSPTVFVQKKRKSSTQKRQRKIQRVARACIAVFTIGIGSYLVTAIFFFSLLGNVRSIVSENVLSSKNQTWRETDVEDLSRKTKILENLSNVLPFPYSLVGISLPREGVTEGLRNLSQFVSGIETFHSATQLLGRRLEQATNPKIQTQISSQQTIALLDESYKDLSAIQADISQGNPIFDSLFGMDGLSTQIVSSTISLRENITQEKAIVSLVDSVLDKQGKSVFLLVFADTTQARPLFGVPTQVYVMTIENGKVQSTQSYQVSDLDQMLKGKVSAPSEMKKYSLISDWKLADGSWSIDGPTAAREIAWFVNKQLHVDVDTVLVMDTQALRTLRGEQNVTSQMVLGTSTTDPNISDRLRIEDLLPSILKSLNSSQAVLFSRDSGVAKTAKSLAWDGSVRTPSCPPVFTLDRDCTVLTRYVSEYDIQSATEEAVVSTQKENQIHEIHVSKEGLSHVDTVTYPQSSKKNERKVLKYLIDTGAFVTSVTINGIQLSPELLSQGEEYQKTSLTFPISLSNESQTTVVISYTTPSVAPQKSSLVFFAQKQPGKNADPLTVEFTFAKEFNPSVVAPKAFIERSRASFTTSLDTSKIFAIGL